MEQPHSLLDGALRAFVEAIVDERLKAVTMPQADSPRSLRISRGLSVAELAGRASVSAGLVSKLESGRARRPDPECLGKIARALQVSEGVYRTAVARLMDKGVA